MTKKQEQELDQLLYQYMITNPEAENPFSNVLIIGKIGLFNLLTIANNRLIEFEYSDDQIDGFIAKIDGKPVEFEM